MAYNALQQKAIQRYMDLNNCKIQAVSAYPTVYFFNEDGDEVKENIQTLVDWYKQDKAEQTRIRARERRLARNK